MSIAHAETAPGQTNAANSMERVEDARTTYAVTFDINGTTQRFEVDAWTTLLDLLREHAHLSGTKKGCDHGQCGACTAIVDGQRIDTCLALAVVRDGASITTIEGLARHDALHPMQQAFIDHDAFQCGYCTPGQICSALAMLNEGHVRCADDIREQMSGNLCRCGAYTNIVAAILDAGGFPEARQDPAKADAQSATREPGARS